MDQHPVYVVGAGGIGCVVGYSLLEAGCRVRFVENDPAKVEWGRRNGVVVNSRPPIRAEFVPFADWSPPDNAWVLLGTKCYDNAAVLARLPPSAQLVPIQNGFDPQLDRFGHELEGIASFVAYCLPGTTSAEVTRPGKLHVGPRAFRPFDDPSLGRFAADLGHAGLYVVELVRDIRPFKHTKLMYNAAISPLAAAAGVDNGELLSDPLARRLFFALIRENYGILSRAGVRLGTVGPFHPRTVAKILRRPWVARVMARFFERSLRGTYCSMAGEIETGRTEIDNYNGHLLRLAGGTPCPLNRAVYDLVRRMERERAKPDRQVLRELALASGRV